MISQVLNHADRAYGHLLFQYKGKPRLEGLIRALGAQVQEAESALWELLSHRLLTGDTVGAQLDLLGRIVGQPRGGFADDVYLVLLIARIATNTGNGTVPEIVGVMRRLAQVLVSADVYTRFTERLPAGFVFQIGGVPTTTGIVDLLLTFLRQLKAGGVRAILEWIDSPPETTFTWGGTAEQGWNAGAVWAHASE